MKLIFYFYYNLYLLTVGDRLFYLLHLLSRQLNSAIQILLPSLLCKDSTTPKNDKCRCIHDLIISYERYYG